MSGLEEAVLESGGDRTRDSGATLVNGLFYGGLAYLIGYLWVYVNILNDSFRNRAAESIYGSPASSLNEEQRESLSLLIPGPGDYAGWVYHYSMGGEIHWSLNFLPGSRPINQSVLYPFAGGPQDNLRETLITEPWMLLHPSKAEYYVRAVQGPAEFAELSFVFVTPTALFLAGFLLAYRHQELTPIGGALAGSKVTAGFLAASVGTTYLFTITLSGISLGGGISAALGPGLGEVGSEMSAELEPELTIAPLMSRSILIGVVYPLAFATLGGAAASLTRIAMLPVRLLRGL